MSVDVGAGVSREVAGDVFYPIAQAIFHAANPMAGELSAQSAAVQNHWFDVAVVACGETFANLNPRAKYNIQLVAQVRQLPDDAILALTQPPINASMETRRSMLIRALRAEASR